jgi:hypothetical protein
VAITWRGTTMRAAKRLRPLLPHEAYRALYGLGRLGYLPNYRRPRTFNEKVTSWLRRARDPRLPQRADKLAVRDFVAAAAPWVRLPEVYAAADDAAAFPFDRLPEVSVLKANHGWAQVEVLRRPFDVDAARATGARWLAQRHGAPEWEWHFRAIPPRLYAERYLGDAAGAPPLDFKVLVFNGRATFVQVFLGRAGRLRRVVFDRDWRAVPVHRPVVPGGAADVVPAHLHPPRPACLDALLRAAEALAEDLPFVRADFYVVGDEPYFGELTFFPAAGYLAFASVDDDRAWGARLDLALGAAPR